MYFVGFYSVPNLIVILFNLMYPVFVMGIYCKGCGVVVVVVWVDRRQWVAGFVDINGLWCG